MTEYNIYNIYKRTDWLDLIGVHNYNHFADKKFDTLMLKQLHWLFSIFQVFTLRDIYIKLSFMKLPIRRDSVWFVW